MLLKRMVTMIVVGATRYDSPPLAHGDDGGGGGDDGQLWRPVLKRMTMTMIAACPSAILRAPSGSSSYDPTDPDHLCHDDNR